METDNKDLTQDIERLKLAASQSMLGRRILLSEENNNSEIYDRGSSVLGSIKDSAHSQDLDGELLNMNLNGVAIIILSVCLVLSVLNCCCHD